MPTKRFRETTPHRRLLSGGDDAYRSTAAAAQDASEFRQSSRRVGKEHQAEVANDGIEAAVAERQRLTVGDHHSIGRGQSGTGRPKHHSRDVGANDHTRVADQRNGRNGGFSSS
jgi:hypothetical protein